MFSNEKKTAKPWKTPDNYKQQVHNKLDSAFEGLDIFEDQQEDVISFKRGYPIEHLVADCDNDTTIPYVDDQPFSQSSPMHQHSNPFVSSWTGLPTLPSSITPVRPSIIHRPLIPSTLSKIPTYVAENSRLQTPQHFAALYPSLPTSATTTTSITTAAVSASTTTTSVSTTATTGTRTGTGAGAGTTTTSLPSTTTNSSGYIVSSMYFENSLKKTWHAAYFDCIDRGMELAILNSATSYNTAKTLIEGSFHSGGYSNADVWIGYYFKDVSTKEYAWINGEKSSYENWNPDDPDYKEDSCVRLKQRAQYKFADWDCLGEYFYLCTSGSPPVVEDTTNTIDTTLGSSVSFDCSYSSLWDAVVQWVHITPNRISIINDTLEPVLYSQSPHSVGTVTKSTLHITSFNSSDVGSYQCQVTNQFGTGMSKNNTLKKHKNFLFRDGDYTWLEAKAGCQTLNMELAVLSTTIDHNDAVNYLYSNNFNPNGIWIGLYSDLDNNASQFIWINGVRVMSLDLAVNEPDNEQIRNQSTCVRMKPSSQYALDDVKCTDTSPYLCTEGSAPSVYTTQSSISLPIRTVILLECPYFSLWNITNVQWQQKTSQETVILDHWKDSSMYGGGTINNSSLVITSLDVNNDGLYRCFVENKFGLGRGEDITVTTNPGIPMIVPTTVIYRVNESANITLTCESFGYPNITTQKWTRSLHGFTVTLKTSSMYLDITNASVSDIGNYTCYVENAEGSTKLVYSIYVKKEGAAPLVYITQSKVLLPVRTKIVLECPYYSLGNITDVHWQRKTSNETVILDHSKDTNLYNGGTICNTSLIINSLDLNNEGIYRCFVGNEFGLGRGEDITVTANQGIPIIVPTTTFYDVNVSATITLTCDAYGYPSISNQYWTRSLGGSTVILKTSSMYLDITNASLSDSSNYTCYVENAVGSRKLVYSVYVNEAESLCPCVCDSIANQNLSHYSFDELKIILAPVTDKLRQTLSVDTSTLSSTIYKRTCMQDDRPSSKRIGYCGIGFLCSVFSTLLLIDITSFKCFGTFK
ncbi:uncharacterized protein LOC143080591 [Mytilus galloprovincialis]|uniref:uncharacterized protein LOC143080591 n=1 Tax=Mytilus galloprovincialis TaxID=29158 RepID=UPI003F7B533F